MSEYKDLEKIAMDCGFSYCGPLDADTIVLRQEARDMCAGGKCHKYATCWSCPPGCGTLQECEGRIRKYKKGIIVQTVGELEDALDGETMVETGRLHGVHVNVMVEKLIENGYKGFLTLGAGCCQICKECTYPDAPCRFPDKMHSSMESYGMIVSEVCKANDIKYYYGANHIAYTGCFLIE